VTAAARTTASGRTPTLVARFSELRAASRALEHLLGAGSEESHRLADALVELSDLARTCGADPGDQRELHAQLDAAEASVRACLERVTLEEVAPRAAAFAPGAEGDALALLEVLLGDVGGPDECRAAVECLVTRLATEVRGGRRLVARDPSTLTPRLAERLRSDAGGRDDPDGLDPGEAEALLLEAAARLDGEATEAVEADVARLKRQRDAESVEGAD